MATLSQLQTWLTEAEIAKHKVALGLSVELRTYQGRTLKYTAANADQLDAYISDLRSQIATMQGNTSKRHLFRVAQGGTGY
jgi:hypothetical protein